MFKWASRKEKSEPTATMEKLNESWLIKSGQEGNPRNRLLIATPTLGVIRIEWACARFGQVTPCNWSATNANIGIGNVVPMHYLVADAQNLAVQSAIEQNFEWLLLWEDDVIAPMDSLLVLNEYMVSMSEPVVSGLYFTKGSWSEPVLYRGRGNSCYHDFKLGDKVYATGVPTGFLLVHMSLLKAMWEGSKPYKTIGGIVTREVFRTPSGVKYKDPIKRTGATTEIGTSDLWWCRRLVKENWLKKAGWPEQQNRKWPILCDTRIMCRHIDITSGKQYPEPYVLKKYQK